MLKENKIIMCLFCVIFCGCVSNSEYYSQQKTYVNPNTTDNTNTVNLESQDIIGVVNLVAKDILSCFVIKNHKKPVLLILDDSYFIIWIFVSMNEFIFDICRYCENFF